ncbi:MAG: hypothetical protein L0H12_00585, partial [Nitrosospira sp.]|nr:hypothetical protein [Nitrosospira sp.]
MVIPFQGVATQPCAAKNVQSALQRTRQKGEGKMMQKVVVDHLLKLKKERSTAGVRFNLNPVVGRGEVCGF